MTPPSTPSSLPPEPRQQLDLRETKCPLNFVQTKLALEKLAVGDVLEVWIQAGGQSVLNIPNSIAKEGHAIVHTVEEQDTQRLWIEKKG